MADATPPGIAAAIAVAVLLAGVAWSFLMLGRVALTGGRNHTVGFRLPSVMRSDAAWRAGHRAAARPLLVGAWAVTVLALLSLAASPATVPYVVVVAATVGALLVQVLWATVAAHRGARRVSRGSARG